MQRTIREKTTVRSGVVAPDTETRMTEAHPVLRGPGVQAMGGEMQEDGAHTGAGDARMRARK